MPRMLSYVILAIALVVPAAAADSFFLGTWKIVSASVAPWWDASYKRSEAEMRSLVGKTVIIGPKSIQGPHAVACSH